MNRYVSTGFAVSVLIAGLLTARASAQCIPGPAWSGDGTYDQVGYRLAGGSDINNDSVPDLIISAPGWDTAHTNGGDYGRVYIYSGADYSLLHVLEAEIGHYAGFIGQALDTLGDVNGDD
jgi:hypothetical protein